MLKIARAAIAALVGKLGLGGGSSMPVVSSEWLAEHRALSRFS
jgi:hypothetical protein